MSTTQPQVTKVVVQYQSNYNGCFVALYFDGNHEKGYSHWVLEKDHPELAPLAESLQNAVVEYAYEDCIKEGRLVGMFNGEIGEITGFAIDKAKELFGDDALVQFSEDGTSD